MKCGELTQTPAGRQRQALLREPGIFFEGYLATTTLIYSLCCPVFSQQGVVSPLTQKGLLLYLTLELHKWENQEAAPHSAARLRKEAAQQCEGVESRRAEPQAL